MAAQREPAPDWTDRIVYGDCRRVLRDMISDGFRVDSCITSPPYWGLRDYGAPGQLGLEDSLESYIAAQADIFDMVRELLTPHPPAKGESPKPAGTLWLNMGDAYVSQRKGSPGTNPSEIESGKRAHSANFFVRYARRNFLRRKNLIGLPWHLAFALQRRGWILRDCIIWEKPNPVPESTKDRTTKCHEYLFMLAPGPVYYYDADAIAELRVTNVDKPVGGWAAGLGAHDPIEHNRPGEGDQATKYEYQAGTKRKTASGERRRPRSVWSIPTEPYKGQHYAAFPKLLAARCLLAGTPAGGTVLDPYMGTGTVAAVAKMMGRHYAGIELNESEYGPLIDKRLEEAAQGLEL